MKRKITAAKDNDNNLFVYHNLSLKPTVNVIFGPILFFYLKLYL